MALTRKMLKAMGIEDEEIEQIIEEHVESVDGLKAERDRYRGGAEEAEGLRKQLEEAKAADELTCDSRCGIGVAAQVDGGKDAIFVTAGVDKAPAGGLKGVAHEAT